MKKLLLSVLILVGAGCQSATPSLGGSPLTTENSSFAEGVHRPIPGPENEGASGGGSEVAAESSSPRVAVPSTLSIDRAELDNASLELVSAYLEATDRIAAEGGIDPSAMVKLVTSDWLPTEERAFRHFLDTGIRSIGTTVFDHFAIQSSRRTATGQLEVAVFVCVDSSNVWVVDASLPDPPEDLVVWLGAGEDRVEPSDEQYATWEEYLDIADPIAGSREPLIVWLLGNQLDDLKIDATESWSGIHPCGVSE